MKKHDYSKLNGDEQVTHNWALLNFEIGDNYKYVINNKLFKLISNVLTLPIFIILYIIDKVFFGFTIIGKEKLIKDNCFVSISNHVHYLDCTLIGLIYYPRRVHYPTLEENFFKIVVDSNVGVQPIRFVFTKSKGIYKIYKRKKCICAVVLDPLYPNMELDYKDRIADLRNRTYESMNKEIEL